MGNISATITSLTGATVLALTLCLAAGVSAQSLGKPALSPQEVKKALDAPFAPPEWLSQTQPLLPNDQMTETNKFGLTVWGKLHRLQGDPAKFRELIATVHRTLELNTKPEFKAACYQTLGMYYELMLEDHVRAFQWYRQLAETAKQVPQIHDDQNHNSRSTASMAILNMARCSAKLALTEDAVAALKPHTFSDWRELLDLAVIHQILGDRKQSDSDIAKAIEAGKKKDPFAAVSSLGRGIILYYANGNMDQVKASLPEYKKAFAAVSAKQGAANLPNNLVGQNTRVDIITARLEHPLPTNLTGLRDGEYTGQSRGLHGPIEVSVRIAGGKVAAIQVTKAEEIRSFNATQSIPARIVAKQSLQVDGVTGATVSSQAIAEAVANAVEKAKN